MRLVAASRILNESDIAEAFVRHTAHFVDHHLIVDNGSTDGTLDILENLKKEGLPISVYQSHARAFIESKLNTFLFQTAVTAHRAEWVIFLDVDEFIDDRELKTSLSETISAFGSGRSNTTCMAVPLRDYCITPYDPDELLVTKRIAHCIPTGATLKVVVPAGLIAQRPIIQHGNHGVLINGDNPGPMVTEPTLSYAHYPTRSPYQWISKVVIGWSKVLASADDLKGQGVAYHYRSTFETLRDNPAAIFGSPPAALVPGTPANAQLDPIEYRGGPLKYTVKTDYAMRAVRVITQRLQELAIQHGELLKLANDFRSIVDRTESGVTRIL
jgi:glycosyltransferase involved in cell wall biosynthesis